VSEEYQVSVSVYLGTTINKHQIQWQIFRVFKVFSEHLKIKKKNLKIGFRAFISD